MTTRTLAAVGALLLALSTPSAHASPLFEVMGGESGGGMNARFSTAGVPSTHFNPALMTQVPRRLSFGVHVVQDAVSMTLMGRSGVDVPLSLLDAYNPDLTAFDDPSFPTEWLENGCDPSQGGRCARVFSPRPRQDAGSSGEARPYASVGLVHGLFQNKLVLGFYVLVPIGDFTGGDQFFVDEREQFFSNSLHAELLSDRLSAPSISVSLGSEIVDGLSIGAGLGIRLRTDAFAETYVTDANDQSGTLQLSTDIGVNVGVAPFAAIAYVFGDNDATLTATVHSPNRFDVGVGVGTILPDGDNQTAKRSVTLDYMPWQIGFGGEVALPTREGLRVALTGGAVYRTWSNYVDRQSDRPSGAYEWSDTISPSLGVRFERTDWNAGADLRYEPTPIPRQTGRTNYVDNDRLGGAAHFSHGFTLADLDMRFGVSGQLNRLLPRSQRKLTPDTTPGMADRDLVLDEFPDDAIDTRRQLPVAEAAGLQTNNPGWPGFESEGWLWGLGLTLEFLY